MAFKENGEEYIYISIKDGMISIYKVGKLDGGHILLFFFLNVAYNEKRWRASILLYANKNDMARIVQLWHLLNVTAGHFLYYC